MLGSAEQNKIAVTGFFAALSDARYDDAFALTRPDGVIHLPQPRQTIPLRQWRGVYESLMQSQFPEGCRYQLHGLLAEGDQVSVRAESWAPMRTGGTYNNQYHWLFRLAEGLIAECHEYLDTLYAHRTIHANGWAGRSADAG